MKRQTEATTLQAWWFSVGNIANNLIFMLITMFMMFFFTNVMGLDPVVAGTLFMVARLVDAFTDPIMGMIIDRTNLKRFGKYRGFIHFGAPLLGVVVVALFTVPNFSAGGKVLYAYIVYILYSLCWTAAVQSEGTLNALLACRSFIPIAGYVITLIAMHFDPIDKQGEADLQVALDELKQKETEVGQAAE